MANTLAELQQLQALPLNIKIRKTEQRIKEWVDYYGLDGVAVSFSGGKDSTVLMDIARRLYPSIKAVFVDIPTQYPELKQFVKTYDNVDIIRPEKNFFQICEEYGFPFISKEISEAVWECKKFLTELENKQNSVDRQTDRQTDSLKYAYRMADFLGIDRRINKENESYKNLQKGIIPSSKKYKYGKPVRVLQLEGKIPHKEKGVYTGEYSKRYDKSRYAFLLNAPFDVSNKCCLEMKKKPLHNYSITTNRVAITAQMASESVLRTSQWIKNGCNAFDAKYPISNPMSFWTEQDVLAYIKINNLPICSVYGEVVTDDEDTGQINMSELLGMELFDVERTPLHTTGCTRTGCVLCGFGAHLEKYPDQRFVNLKKTHPQMYKMLDVCKNNGVTYREAIDWVNEHGNLRNRIEY